MNIRTICSLVVGIVVLVVPGVSRAATLYITPSSSDVRVGDMVQLYVVVNAGGVAINNAEATVTYPTALLELVSAGKSGSIFSLWIEEPSTDTLGAVSFNGGVPNPGYAGSSGRLVSLVFRAKAAGSASVAVSGAAVRANDGLGTDVLSGSSNAAVVISEHEQKAAPPPAQIPQTPQASPEAEVSPSTLAPISIRSSTHPDQGKWYRSGSPAFSWDLPAGALEVRTILSERSSAVPNVRYSPAISSKAVEHLPDGTYYFFLQVRTSDGWSAVSRYQVNIDTTPPREFSIIFPHGSVGFDPQPVILFNTSDGASGVDRYDVKVGEGGPLQTAAPAESNPYVLPLQEPGAHEVIVTAFDRAGNATPATAAFTIEGIDPPKITGYPDAVTVGDMVRIRGTTYPNATVEIVVNQDGAPVTTESAKSNSLGDFSIIIAKRLWAGTYTFTARATDDRGARSPQTSPYTVTVQLQFFADALNFILNYFVAALAFLLAVAAIAGVGVWCWFRLVRFGRVLKHESDEAETEIHRAFRVLRDGVAKHIRALHKAHADRTLTLEELTFLEELEDTLADAEHTVLREVRDLASQARKGGK